MPPAQTRTWSRSFSGQIEHRLFCHITQNWRGRPLTSHEVIVQSIAATTTSTGLHVRAALDTGKYPTGVTIGNAHMAALPIARHTFHGDWNYTLHPASPPGQPPAETALAPVSLSHPQLTGMSTQDLTDLIAQLDALRTSQIQARNEQKRQRALDQGRKPHEPRSGRPPRFAFPDRVLATVLHLRLQLPPDTLAPWFTISRQAIRRAITDVQQLLDQHGTTITPTNSPATTTALLQRASKRQNNPNEIKTAC